MDQGEAGFGGEGLKVKILDMLTKLLVRKWSIDEG